MSSATKASPAASEPALRDGSAELRRSESSLRAQTRRSVLFRYGIALALVGTALLASIGMQRLFAFPYPFLFLFLGAVMVGAWFGGMGAGLFAVLLSTVLVDYFFVPPFYSLEISTTAETYFVAFVTCALVAGWVSSIKKRSEEQLQEARDQLEIKVSERSAALMQTQAELARLSRVLSMGELTASIAHEISQPITAVVTNGHACLQWLSTVPPNLEKVQQSAESIIKDGNRAGAVIARIRALFRKEEPVKNWVDINEVIQELVGFLRHEATIRHISIRTDLTSSLPAIKADRVQLQQVILNLVMNAMDALSEASNPAKEIVIRSRAQGENEVLVAVEDCGAGINLEVADKVFEPFFTTKPNGIGVGLSISRSIVESHQGRLWASANPTGGAILQFSLPMQRQSRDE
ncbi:MAG TPA: ATP-binding protein [Terriglobales bacterium]|nr:ATP-binding protein [Terriglobales bacterium]